MRKVSLIAAGALTAAWMVFVPAYALAGTARPLPANEAPRAGHMSAEAVEDGETAFRQKRGSPLTGLFTPEEVEKYKDLPPDEAKAQLLADLKGKLAAKAQSGEMTREEANELLRKVESAELRTHGGGACKGGEGYASEPPVSPAR